MADSALSFCTSLMNRCIDGLRAGNRAAANELVRRAEHRFHRLAHRMYRGFPNVRPVAEAGDVIQESWLRLFRSLQKLRPENTCKFFLLASVEIRRELLDLARKAKSRKHQAVSLQPVGGDGDSSSGFPVAEPADRTPDDFDLWTRFHEAVEELEPDLRAVVSLVFYHDRTQAEIADLLKKDVRTIGRWWHDACVELRARVGWTPPGE